MEGRGGREEGGEGGKREQDKMERNDGRRVAIHNSWPVAIFRVRWPTKISSRTILINYTDMAKLMVDQQKPLKNIYIRT